MQLSHLGRGGLLAGALVGGALLLGACGSSSTTPPTTTAGGGATTTTSGGGVTTTTTGGATTTTAAGGGSGLSALAQALQSGENQSFDAMYKATQSNGQAETVEFASSPPSDFAEIVTNSSGTEEFIGGTAHAYVCQVKTSGPSSCVDLGAGGFGAYGAAMQFYEGKFWYNDIETIKSAGAAAGYSVTSSTMSVAGQSLNCVSFSGGPAGATSSGTVCVTSSGVLGYVKTSSVTFELTSVSSSPPASKFQPPAGATITTVPAGF